VLTDDTEEKITVDLTGHSGRGVQLQLRDQGGNLVAYVSEPPYHLEYTGPAGQYYVYIYTESGHNSNTPYTLRATFSAQVALRTFHERYVTAMDDQLGWDWELRAHTEWINYWEIFTLIWRGNDTIALKTFHGKYVTAMDAAQEWVLEGKKDSSIGACEKFTLEHHPDNKVAFYTCHNKYVSAKEGDEEWLLKQAKDPWGWEMFVLVSPP